MPQLMDGGKGRGPQRSLAERNAATEATPRTQGRIGVSFGRLRVHPRAGAVQPGAFSRLSGLLRALRRHPRGKAR